MHHSELNLFAIIQKQNGVHSRPNLLMDRTICSIENSYIFQSVWWNASKIINYFEFTIEYLQILKLQNFTLKGLDLDKITKMYDDFQNKPSDRPRLDIDPTQKCLIDV